jgi:hypothetical protein
MAYIDNRLPFQVVRGSEQKIKEMDYNEGFVYFAIDTKKIFLDTKDERLSMGGNTGIFYADVEFESKDLAEYFFQFDQIENGVPNINDLILNGDGCFYKVKELFFNDSLIKTEKITLAGGNGNGDGESEKNGSIKISFYPEAFDKRPTKTVVSGSECKIPVIFDCKTAEGERVTKGRYELHINGQKVKSGDLYSKANEDAQDIINNIDITDIVRQPNTYTIWLYAYGYNGGIKEDVRSRQFTIVSSLFEINWTKEVTTESLETKINDISKDFNLEWSIGGGLDNVFTHIEINNQSLPKISGNKLTLKPEDLKGYKIEHGAYKIKI